MHQHIAKHLLAGVVVTDVEEAVGVEVLGHGMEAYLVTVDEHGVILTDGPLDAALVGDGHGPAHRNSPCGCLISLLIILASTHRESR